jgi:hypothetical protein
MVHYQCMDLDNAIVYKCMDEGYRIDGMEMIEWKFTFLINLRLLDLTRNSCEINVYKFPLDNFHLQYPSTIIESSEMPTKSLYLPIT